MRRRRLGILVAFGLALLEATAAPGLAAFGRWDLGWVAALATLALATYTLGVALVVARRRERWAGMRHSPRAER